MSTDKAAPDTLRLRDLAKAAKSGPWFHLAEEWEAEPFIGNVWRSEDGNPDRARAICHDITRQEDAEYISAADPTTILSLLDRIEELQRRWDQQAMDHFEECSLCDSTSSNPLAYCDYGRAFLG